MKIRSIVAGCLAGTLFGCATDSLSTTDQDVTITTVPTWHPTTIEEESTEIPNPPALPAISRLPLVTQIPRAGALTDAQTATYGTASATGVRLESGVLTITGTGLADTASVIASSRITLSVTLNHVTSSYSTSAVGKIVFYGLDGDDTFTNSTSIPSTINGGDGNDILNGGSGDDFIVGGYGQDTIHGNAGDDTIWGSGGSDTLYGDDGDDVIFGHGGNDEIHGGAGRDTINGGSGNDTIFGDSGQDLIVAVGNGADTITGGSQWDNYWIDSSDTITDISADEGSMGYVHTISSFRSVQRAGKPTVAVGLNPVGEDLPDPDKIASHTAATLVDYSDHPLFASGGPSKDDIFQGAVGDCYFVSKLSAWAGQNPEEIRRTVAPLGDGSYAVRLYRNGAPDYIRVDSDLWTESGTPKYARNGQEGALWPAIIEKAFAIARRDQGNYDSIAGGNGTTLSNLMYTSQTISINDGVSDVETIDWVNAGKPAGATKNTMQGSVTMMLLAIDAALADGAPMTTGSVSSIDDINTPIRIDDPSTSSNESTYRRGQHIFMVDHVNFDAAHNPVSLTLRNPYGSYKTIADLAHLHFCIGRANQYDDLY